MKDIMQITGKVLQTFYIAINVSVLSLFKGHLCVENKV